MSNGNLKNNFAEFTTNSSHNTDSYSKTASLRNQLFLKKSLIAIIIIVTLLIGFFILHTSMTDNCISGHQCENGGDCVDAFNSYSCRCAAGYEGNHCEVDIDDCAGSTVCLNGGTCIDGSNTFSCNCLNGFTGNFCEVPTCSAAEKYSRNSVKIVTMNESGVIQIPAFPSKGSFLFEYIPNEKGLHGGKPRLWTLQNVNMGKYYYFKIKVTLLCASASDTFSVLDWKHTDSSMVLSSKQIDANAEAYDTTSRWAYKLFLSYTWASGQSPGFLVLIDIVQIDHLSYGSNFVYTSNSTPGSLSYGPTKSFDKFSLVLNPKETNTTLTVVNLVSQTVSCTLYDTMDVYEILPRGDPNRLSRLCGNKVSPLFYLSVSISGYLLHERRSFRAIPADLEIDS